MTDRPRLKLEAFDGLRAMAAFLVIAYHVAITQGLTRMGVLAPLAAELKAGVTVFFVISGCLLYMPYARAIRDRDRLPSWRDYTRRRAVRILPGYWVALTVLGLCSLIAPIFTADWWRYYGLTQIYSPTTFLGGLGVAWSLCVEVTFYLCLPFFARGMAALVRRGGPAQAAKRQLVVVGALGLLSILLRGAVCRSLIGSVPGSGAVLETALPGMLDWFALGIVLAVLAVTWESDPGRFRGLRWLAGKGGLCWALAGALYVAGAWAQHGDMLLSLYGVCTHVALGLASALLILPAIKRDSRAPAVAMLRSPLMAWLGTISYGIYLWHDSLLNLLTGSAGIRTNHPASIGHALALFLATAAGAVVLGAASWYLVERPAQRLLRRARIGAPIILAPEPGVAGT